VKIVSPFLFLIFSAMGMACGLSYISELMFFCGFFIAFANGSIYAQANKKIDRDISEDHSVTAFSFWLFLGDVGSVAGSNLITAVSDDIKRFYH
jgi:MFS-type transporter involved in bile tolerance (Atg22 family)